MKKFEGDMITAYILIGVAGVFTGTVATVAIMKDSQTVDPIIIDPVVVDPVGDVAKQITDLDLLIEPCSTNYIKEQGDLLCREMYCLVMTRGVDSQTGGSQCEQIANIANSQIVINHCETFLEDKDDCYSKYKERK